MANHSLFTFQHGGSFIANLVYVDNMILAGNDLSKYQEIKSYLSTCFHIKDLSKLKYFLDLEVVGLAFRIIFNQRMYLTYLMKLA